MKKILLGVLLLFPSLSIAQTLDPSLEWKFNGYSSKGKPNGISSLNPNGSVADPVNDAQISTKIGPLYKSNIRVCTTGDTLPDGTKVTDASKLGNMYSVGDILKLNDGSIITLTSVGNKGTLVDVSWTYKEKAVNNIDPTTIPTKKYTTDVTKTGSLIKNIKSSNFKSGCLEVSSVDTMMNNNVVTPQFSSVASNNGDIIIPDVVSNPDGAWIQLNGLLNDPNPNGQTFNFSSNARLPIDWGNNNTQSPVTIDSNNYNLLHLVFNGQIYGSASNYGVKPEWNGTTYPLGLPESALVEGYSPRWGVVHARKYSDDSIYNFSDKAYRTPAPLATYNYYKHVDGRSENSKACSQYPAWSANKAYSFNDTVYWQKDSKTAFLYTAVTSGKSDSKEPAFTGAETSNIADGSSGLKWSLIGESDDHRDPKYEVYGWCAGDNNRGMGNNVINYYTDTNSGIGTTVINNMLTTSGKNGWGGFDINQYNTMLQSGTNWSWVEVNQLSEVGSIGIGYNDPDNSNSWVAAGKMNYVEEWNLSGIGKDDPESYYDPRSSNRIVWWFSPWQNGGLKWKANSAVGKQQILLVKDSSGQDWMYTAKDDCTEGSTVPAWKFNETKTISDGTCKWVFDGKRKFQIGRFIGVDKNHGADEIEYGTLMGSESVIYNSIFDFSTVTFTDDVDDGVHSLVRSPINTFWDMSADGTRAGQNKHLLGLSSTNGDHLQYSAPDESGNVSMVYGVRNSGIVMYNVKSVSAAGTSITDATTTPLASIVIVNGGTGGIKLTADLYQQGSVQTIVNLTGSDIKVYPIDAGWSIMTNSAGSPYVVPTGKSVDFIDSGYNNNFVVK